MFNNSMKRFLAVAGALALSLAACSSNSSSDNSAKEDKASSNSSSSEGKMQIAASFYPIKWLVESIGGDLVEVSSITPANVEPHDYELSPKQIADLTSNKMIFYVKGFQPSLDEAAETVPSPTITVDLLRVANLEEHEGLIEHDHDSDHAEEEASAGEHADHHHDDAVDPHFWLDPKRMSDVAEAIYNQFVKVDPDNAEQYKKNLEATQKKLATLRSNYETGLDRCETHSFVTTHTAFGYLADRFYLNQIALSGLDPEAEPSPAVLAEVKKFIEEKNIKTIFTETLVSSKTAEALAKETGATTDVLDPLESEPSSGDYIDTMEANLTALRKALACS